MRAQTLPLSFRLDKGAHVASNVDSLAQAVAATVVAAGTETTDTAAEEEVSVRMWRAPIAAPPRQPSFCCPFDFFGDGGIKCACVPTSWSLTSHCPTVCAGGGKGGGGGGGGLGAGLREVRDWDLSKLPVFEKNFYYEHPDVTQRPEEHAREWRNRHGIVVEGEGVPKPCMTFEEASMPSYVQDEVLKCGFSSPTPIQSQGWPMALLGRDMIGISKTGSGKTLAFLLPAMIHINAQVGGSSS